MENKMKEGWKCPVCNSVYAPFVRECEKCNKSSNNVFDGIVYKAFCEGKEYGISTMQPDAWDDGDADAFALSDACELLCRMQGRGE